MDINFIYLFILVVLLSGAENMNNIDLSQNVYDRMKKLFPQTTNPLISAAVLLANVYASSGHIDKASDIRIQLHKSGMKKNFSLVFIGRQDTLKFIVNENVCLTKFIC